MYLTITRTGISSIVQTLKQHMSKPNEAHLGVVHMLLRYFKSTIGQGILYPTNNSFKLQTFTDSDWARCEQARKSITGLCH